MPATASKSTRKSATRPPVVRDRVLQAVAQGQVTAKDLGVQAGYLRYLETNGFVQEAGQVQSGKRGRPALQVKLTPKGRGRVRTLTRKAA